MAELVVALVERSPHPHDIRAGTVICICPDGWAWTEKELTNPDWRIIRSPLVQTEQDALTVPVFDYPETAFADLKQRRQYLIDVAALPIGRPEDPIIEIGHDELTAIIVEDTGAA